VLNYREYRVMRRLRQTLFLYIVLLCLFVFGCQHGSMIEKANLDKNVILVEETPDLLLDDIYSKEEEEEIEVSLNDTKSVDTEVSLPEGIEMNEKVPHLWPIKDGLGYISSWFGSSRSKGGGRTRVHKGVDIIVPRGTSVISTADGVVRLSRPMNGYGLLIVIEHADGIYSAYGHLSELLVKVGDIVKGGDIIGLSGATGRVTTPHLHYEVRKGEKAMNPVWFLPATD